jgi:hypothetical protein
MSVHERVEQTASRIALRRKVDDSNGESHSSEPSHHLVGLQRSMGNAYVARMLAQREAPPEEEKIQTHRDTDSSHSTSEVGLEGGPISEGLSSRINSKRGGGSTLDNSTRQNMEKSFGSSFDDVRIHADSESDSLNRSISAKAFTTGSDIFFSRDASPGDSSLLAHELTHVVQQRGASQTSGPLTVGPAGDSHEQTAHAVAGTVSSGGAIASAQRMEEDQAEQPIARAEVPNPEEETPV